MSIDMGTYVPRQPSVRAVRVTKANIKSVAGLLDCKVRWSKYDPSRPYLVARPMGETSIVYLGDWVIEVDGGYTFLEHDEFVDKYKEAE